MGRSATATPERDLGRRVYGLTAGLAAGLAGACALAWGRAEAAGVVVGSAIMLANFAGLRFAVGRIVTGAGGVPSRAAGPALWIGASRVRLGLVALAVGVAVSLGGVGLRGLLVSLVVLPLGVVAAGLVGARAD